MKRLLIVIGILVIFGAVTLALLSRTDRSPGIAPAIAGAPTSAAAVARGEYLIKAADCVACHTVGETGKPFAGGVAFKLPFGTIYSTNITADPTYGIGAYTDDEFVRAVREGVRRDGKHLYPAFPYTSYTQLSRDDVLAIKAYLWTLPPAAQPNRPNELGFPFNQRLGHVVLEGGFPQERPLYARPHQVSAMEQRRLSRHRARALRGVPHAAQPRIRTGARSRARGRGGARLARL
jgi:mono/diheme cytochrome c family protein